MVISKFVRKRLGIKPRGSVIAELREGELVIRGLDVAGLLRWLRETRKPVASRVSRLGLENEALEVVP
jgi:bifunctional DNA-binding transcriptional regulator/antitoxin component of YhaV-PrlF toxin-antitoxin module